jgi:chemotaxis protein CheD
MKKMSTKKTIVHVSDAKVSRDPTDVLITYSLGSCIAVCLYDPVTHIGGMLHYQLPSSAIETDRSKEKPFMFADSGMNILMKKLTAMGARKKRIQVKIAGGAAMDTGPQGFDIGKRNHLALRKILWQNGMFLDGEDVGGTSPRNMYMCIADGSVTVKSNNLEKNL